MRISDWSSDVCSSDLLAGLNDLAERVGIPLLATNDTLYATREQRPLHDVITCIREGTNLHDAGRLLRANGERHLKPPQEMRRLLRTCPEAVDESAKLLERIAFSLRDLAYEYPHEPVPEGWEPQSRTDQPRVGKEGVST